MELNQRCSARLLTGSRAIVSVFFLLFITTTSLSAQDQHKLLEKRITLQLTQVSVADVLNAIASQASCQFSYSSNQLQAQRIVSVNYKNSTVEAALKELLGDHLKRIRVNDTQIFLQTAGPRGIIKGTVTTSDGKPAPGVTIQLQGTQQTVISAGDGAYRLEASEGNYEIIVSFIGLQTQRQQIAIKESQTSVADFTLQESSQQLQEIIVTTARHNQFANSQSDDVAKMPLKNLENPQVYSTVSKELLSEQLITDFGNALKNTPGVYKIQGSRGINSDGASFYTVRGFRTEASLVDGVPMQTNGEFDPANIEKVEVLKGPSGTLFGGAITNLGGLINVVTKKPLETAGGEVAYTTGSFDLNRISADVYGPANKNNNVFVRLNAAYQYQGSWQDAGFRRTVFLAPAIEYRASDKLTLHLNASFYTSEATSSPSIFLNRTRNFIATKPEELNFNWKNSFTNNDITMKTPTTNVYGKIVYKISDRWTSRTSFSTNNRKSDGIYQYEFVRGTTDERVERNVSAHNVSNTNIDIQENVTGDFNIGSLKNRLLVGVDYMQQKANNSISAYVAFDTVYGSQIDPRYGIISREAIENRIAAVTSGLTRNYSTVNIYSTYVSDIINITSRLSALLGIRMDKYNSAGTFNRVTGAMIRDSEFDRTTFSSKFGLVYQVVKDQVSVFGNYMNGFQYLSSVVQPLPDTSGVMKPQQANQWEAGVKLDVIKNRLSITASYYDIKLKDATRVDAVVRNGTSYNITVQDGTQISKGFEAEVLANPAKGLQVMAGYGHNSSTLTRAIAALEGRRPASAGPADLVNAWASYTVQTGKMKGIGAGFGGNYISEHLTANSAVTGVFTLPAYTLLNATLFYEAKSFRIAAKLDNISNKLYFAGQGVLTAQMPRSFSANLTVRF